MRMMKAGENPVRLLRQIFSAGWLSRRCLFKNVIIAGLSSPSANVWMKSCNDVERLPLKCQISVELNFLRCHCNPQ